MNFKVLVFSLSLSITLLSFYLNAHSKQTFNNAVLLQEIARLEIQNKILAAENKQLANDKNKNLTEKSGQENNSGIIFYAKEIMSRMMSSYAANFLNRR